MIPITGILQFHLAPNGFIDPYIGGGAAYVLFDDIEDIGLDDLDRIDFKDDVGFVVNAGVGIRLGNRFGIVLDGKYVPIEADATAINLGATEEDDTRVDISPIIISAGLHFAFSSSQPPAAAHARNAKLIAVRRRKKRGSRFDSRT